MPAAPRKPAKPIATKSAPSAKTSKTARSAEVAPPRAKPRPEGAASPKPELPPASAVTPADLLGRAAPELDLEGPEGRRVKLADFKGKQLVLYFYPKDDTPGCTLEAQDFQAARAAFARRNAEVVGVSRDSAASHARFCAKYGLGLTLLSDPDARVLRAYGAWAEKVLYGKRGVGIVRSTFVIDARGVVVAAFPKVKVAGHVDAVLAALA